MARANVKLESLGEYVVGILAHEKAHCAVRFLMKDKMATTPRSGQNPEKIEAGYIFERTLWGHPCLIIYGSELLLGKVMDEEKWRKQVRGTYPPFFDAEEIAKAPKFPEAEMNLTRSGI